MVHKLELLDCDEVGELLLVVAELVMPFMVIPFVILENKCRLGGRVEADKRFVIGPHLFPWVTEEVGSPWSPELLVSEVRSMTCALSCSSVGLTDDVVGRDIELVSLCNHSAVVGLFCLPSPPDALSKLLILKGKYS